MSDDALRWRLGARLPGSDYRVFRTSFVEGVHPVRGTTKRFSVLEAVDWVNVIALTAEQRVVLVRQYRVGIDRVCLEIPGGMIDPGEDPITAGLRELREETGYSGGRATYLGKVAPNPAIQNNFLHTILVEGVTQTHELELESDEVIEVETAPLAEVRQKLLAGEIEHALVVVAFAHLALRNSELRV
jgi:ADP-ribose pyrophosphatase